MPNKFKVDDVVVPRGTTTPVMTVVEVIERENKPESKVLKSPYYRCSSRDNGISEYEEDEIELYANI